MPMDQNEQNLQNELNEQLERQQERAEPEPEPEEHEPEQMEQEPPHAEHPRPNAMQQGAVPGQTQWMDNIDEFRVRQAEEAQMRNEPLRRELASKARAEQKEADERKRKRQQRDQQYDRQIERGGPGAIWAALKKAFRQLVGDVVSDVARGLWTGVKMGAGLAKDAVIDHYRTRGRDAAMNDRPAVQPEPTVQQAQPEMANTVAQPEPTAEQPEAMPHPAEQERSFAERRDSIGRELNGLDTMCRSAAIITGEQPSRRDLSVALACMHDPQISGMSAGQSRFESEKIMRFLSGEKLNPQDGPLNQELLKKGLNAARQPGL